MCMTGDRIPAAEAYRIGLVNHVYTHIPHPSPRLSK
jgi:enoyl-CoA hydratase/carnithine racemase